MSINLSNVNVSIAEFQRISSGSWPAISRASPTTIPSG